MIKEIKKYIEDFYLTDMSNPYVISLLAILIAYVLFLVTNKIILHSISKIFQRTSTKFDDILLEQKVFHKLPYLIPLIFLYSLRDLVPFFQFMERFIISLIALVILLTMNSLINAFNDLYKKSRFSEKFNIKSYTQVAKLIINSVGIIIIAALVAGKSPIYFLSGLGALTAVLILVFKDTILSLVSSVQISSNDLFKVGDWIEAPQFGADGNVVDIALHSVKVQNWDKTICVIPTSKLINSSFKNWRGMSESGGRRIKRSIKINMKSIKFCNASMIEKFKSISLLNDYINEKITEIKKENENSSIEDNNILNGRSLTNIGTFRAYIKFYLKNNPNIHEDMTFLIRQLSPQSDGLPIEIYVFSNDTDWVNYESIQSDIFDHLLAILPEFELEIFQSLSGNLNFIKN
ncbi:MAG: mechanosensitive ion channel protein MscS [Candidatus Marinimicrobia bacterium]|nr:mechanosensitive ion channel protein MscS [Candidatus Neomarinimicrobiota bacterium]